MTPLLSCTPTPGQWLYLGCAVLISTALSMWGGYRMGVIGERLRMAKAIAAWDAQLALKRSAADFARATAYLGKAKLGLVRGKN